MVDLSQFGANPQLNLSQFGANPQFAQSPESTGIVSPLVSGNYISPEQAMQMRLYANSLSNNAMKMPVRNGWQGLAQMTNALMGGLLSKQADDQQRQMINQGAGASTPVYKELGAVNGMSTDNGGSSSASTDTTPTQPTDMSAYQDAISHMESGGNYSALGPLSKSGDRPYGKYQVMGSNIPSWTQDALGKSMTPQQFLQSPDAQDAVFNHKFGGYVQQYGPQDAASMWLTGRPLAQGGAGAADVNGTTGQAYSDQFMQRLGNSPAKAAIDQSTGGQTPAPGGAHVPTWQEVQQDNAQGTANIQARTAGDAPAAAAYAPNAPQAAPTAPLQSGPTAPHQASGGLNPAMMARINADPTVPQNVKDSMNSLIAPQTVEGAFGQRYITSPYAQIHGVAPVQGLSGGKMVPAQGDTPAMVPALQPDGSHRMQMVTPGSVIPPLTGSGQEPTMPPQGRTMAPQGGGASASTPQVQGGAAPAPQGGGGAQQASGTYPNGVQGDSFNPNHPLYSPKTPIAPYLPPYPSGPNATYDDILRYNAAKKAGSEAQSADAANASKAVEASQGTMGTLQSTQNSLNSIRGYMSQLSKGQDPNTIFGPLQPTAEKVMGVLNQLGATGKVGQDTLGNIQAIKKGLNQVIGQQSQALEGTNGRALAAGIELATSSSPNPEMSYQGIMKTMDTLEKVVQYRQSYETAKQQWVAQNHNLLGFEQEWKDGVNGKASYIPEAKPMILSKTPIADMGVSKQDGQHYVKVPSTSSRGYSYVPFSETQ